MNTGRFQYTGQAWIDELGMYYYKARFYSPRLGRFMQTDPIGYDDQINLYAYVRNDPMNNTDPTGKETCFNSPTQCAAYRKSLELAARAGNGQLAEKIRNDRNYYIVFLPKEKIEELYGPKGFSFTDKSVDGEIVITVLPDDFSELYENYPGGTVPEAERAGVVSHEGSHYEDIRNNKPKEYFEGGRNSPSEKKADAVQNSTVKRASEICRGTRIREEGAGSIC